MSLGTFAEMAEQGAVHYPITHERASELEEPITVNIQEAYNGSISCQEALDRAESGVNAILGN
jgi:hypothetical protein